MQSDHNVGWQSRRRAGLGWILVAGIGALAAAIIVPEANAEKQSSEIVITCINQVSGASWQIKIDYERRTVDSNPARISDTEISWRGATDRWYYRLDRKSGNLEVVLASATGGNFLHHRCNLGN
ncbi:MAG: hypothetical protein WBX25_12045 [Rhodomicrobium sp.]